MYICIYIERNISMSTYICTERGKMMHVCISVYIYTYLHVLSVVLAVVLSGCLLLVRLSLLVACCCLAYPLTMFDFTQPSCNWRSFKRYACFEILTNGIAVFEVAHLFLWTHDVGIFGNEAADIAARFKCYDKVSCPSQSVSGKYNFVEHTYHEAWFLSNLVIAGGTWCDMDTSNASVYVRSCEFPAGLCAVVHLGIVLYVMCVAWLRLQWFTSHRSPATFAQMP